LAPSPPAPPPSSPTTFMAYANSQGELPLPLWALLSMGLVAAFLLLVLGYHLGREANLRASRDRANLDLQMMSHQQQVQIRVHNNADSSVPDSLPADPMSFAKVPPVPSLPPGPPSSSATDLSVAEQQDVLRSGPAHSWSAHHWAAPKPSPLSAPSPDGATVGIKKRRRRRASAAAPPAKKAYTSPFHEFCLEQRPLLPPGCSWQERERRLGELPPLLAIACSV